MKNTSKIVSVIAAAALLSASGCSAGKANDEMTVEKMVSLLGDTYSSTESIAKECGSFRCDISEEYLMDDLTRNIEIIETEDGQCSRTSNSADGF